MDELGRLGEVGRHTEEGDGEVLDLDAAEGVREPRPDAAPREQRDDRQGRVEDGRELRPGDLLDLAGVEAHGNLRGHDRPDAGSPD